MAIVVLLCMGIAVVQSSLSQNVTITASSQHYVTVWITKDTELKSLLLPTTLSFADANRQHMKVEMPSLCHSPTSKLVCHLVHVICHPATISEENKRS